VEAGSLDLVKARPAKAPARARPGNGLDHADGLAARVAANV
jgi:hypothetical protein